MNNFYCSFNGSFPRGGRVEKKHPSVTEEVILLDALCDVETVLEVICCEVFASARD